MQSWDKVGMICLVILVIDSQIHLPRAFGLRYDMFGGVGNILGLSICTSPSPRNDRCDLSTIKYKNKLYIHIYIKLKTHR